MSAADEAAPLPRDETAWLIESPESDVSAPRYLCFPEIWREPLLWTEDVSRAARFARREDAEAFARWKFVRLPRICEHGWIYLT